MWHQRTAHLLTILACFDVSDRYRHRVPSRAIRSIGEWMGFFIAVDGLEHSRYSHRTGWAVWTLDCVHGSRRGTRTKRYERSKRMTAETLDTQIRLRAFEHVRRLSEISDVLTSSQLQPGFDFAGTRIPLISPRGIYKPQQMRFLLSIKTVFPVPGGRVWYDDQREVHRQIYKGEEAVDYAFMGKDPNSADNRWLREACENRIPIIYFLGVAPARYYPIVPAYITGWDALALKARVAFSRSEHRVDGLAENSPDRRYAMRTVKQRLHQISFRESVIAAYDGRCAISGLPEPLLLDAAHIIADRDESLGQPVIPNGIPLSKIHHAAFDTHLIGIDPDYRLHVSERLLDKHDGPLLEALKRLKGETIRTPIRLQDHPDRDRLAMRFERFKATI